MRRGPLRIPSALHLHDERRGLRVGAQVHLGRRVGGHLERDPHARRRQLERARQGRRALDDKGQHGGEEVVVPRLDARGERVVHRVGHVGAEAHRQRHERCVTVGAAVAVLPAVAVAHRDEAHALLPVGRRALAALVRHHGRDRRAVHRRRRDLLVG